METVTPAHALAAIAVALVPLLCVLALAWRARRSVRFILWLVVASVLCALVQSLAVRAAGYPIEVFLEALPASPVVTFFAYYLPASVSLLTLLGLLILMLRFRHPDRPTDAIWLTMAAGTIGFGSLAITGILSAARAAEMAIPEAIRLLLPGMAYALATNLTVHLLLGAFVAAAIADPARRNPHLAMAAVLTLNALALVILLGTVSPLWLMGVVSPEWVDIGAIALWPLEAITLYLLVRFIRRLPSEPAAPEDAA